MEINKKVDKFIRCTFIIMGMAHPVFGIIQKYQIVTLGIGINENRICCRSCAEDHSDEGTI